MTDARDMEARYGNVRAKGFDEGTMTITVSLPMTEEELAALEAGGDASRYDPDSDGWLFTFPATFEVCGLCDGTGKHVNPSIDAHGISAEEFADDPGFREEYFAGAYDVTCYRCKGRRVEPVIDESRADKDALRRYNEDLEDEYEYQRQCEAERRMGA